jgi:hypothetical protein
LFPLVFEDVYAQGTNGRLMAAYWEGNGWNWYDLSSNVAGGTSITGSPCVATWAELSGLWVETVFAQGANGHLEEAYYNIPAGWHWYDVSTAPGGISITGSPCVTTWINGSLPLGEETLFARGTNGDLEEAWWIGNGFNWFDVSTAPGGTTISPMTLQRGTSRSALPSSSVQVGTALQSSIAQQGNSVRLPSSPATGTDGAVFATSRVVLPVDLLFASRVRRHRPGVSRDELGIGEELLASVGQDLA